MSTQQAIWHGTTDEGDLLKLAIQKNCDCPPPNEDDGSPTGPPCAAHRMLDGDQRAVDGLVFMYRIAARLSEEEFLADVSPCSERTE